MTLTYHCPGCGGEAPFDDMAAWHPNNHAVVDEEIWSERCPRCGHIKSWLLTDPANIAQIIPTGYERLDTGRCETCDRPVWLIAGVPYHRDGGSNRTCWREQATRAW